jgi:hypothetical protein
MGLSAASPGTGSIYLPVILSATLYLPTIGPSVVLPVTTTSYLLVVISLPTVGSSYKSPTVTFLDSLGPILG